MEQVAAGIVPAYFGTMVMFAGFVIPPPSIPNWWIWVYYLNPFHYSLEACMINELVGTTYHCAPSEFLPPPYNPLFSMPYPQGFDHNAVCQITHGEQQLHVLKMHTSFAWRWAHLAIVLAFAVFFILLTFVGGAKVNHSSKLVCLLSSF
jgi:ATP-binding cassette subfamily G (WHITE) protein 2 (SNQ2)